MHLFPIFLKLTGKPVLVVGGGAVARSKIESLLDAGARLRVVAPQADGVIREWGREQSLMWEPREFQPSDVRDSVMVFAATGISRVDRAVFAACRARRVLCNVVDDPAYCDFYSAAIARRGDLQIAVSTAGRSPALAQQIRDALLAQYGPEWEHRLRELGQARRELLASSEPGAVRVALLHQQAADALRTASVRAHDASPQPRDGAEPS